MPKIPGGYLLDDRRAKLYAGLCVVCEHRFEDGSGCAAFPDELPEDIADFGFDHRNPYPGDQGIRFKPAKGVKEGDIGWMVNPLRQPGDPPQVQ